MFRDSWIFYISESKNTNVHTCTHVINVRYYGSLVFKKAWLSIKQEFLHQLRAASILNANPSIFVTSSLRFLSISTPKHLPVWKRNLKAHERVSNRPCSTATLGGTKLSYTRIGNGRSGEQFRARNRGGQSFISGQLRSAWTGGGSTKASEMDAARELAGQSSYGWWCDAREIIACSFGGNEIFALWEAAP